MATIPSILTCSSLQEPANGVVLSTGPYFKNGSRAVIGCLSGYILDGSSTLTCSTLGWTNTFPVCVPEDKSPNIETDVDIKMEPNSGQHWYILALIILGGILCLLLLGMLIAWCVHMTRCCQSNSVLPYMENYRQIGCCCCCKKFVLIGDHRQTTNENNPKHPKNNHHDGNHNLESDVKHENEVNLSGTSLPDAKKPAVWMPHSNPVRNINTSTK